MIITTVLLILGFSTTVLGANGACDLPKYCTPSQVIGCMSSIDFGNTYYKEAVDDIIKLVEPYVYLDILKNPPQPEGFNNYFKPVDLIAELRKVKTEGTNFYEFYRSVQKALMSTQDGHFEFTFYGNKDFDNKLGQFTVTPPLKLYVSMNNNNEPVMKGVPLELDSGDVYNHFANGAATKETIERNKDNFIVSINGMSPFDFVLNFGSEYYSYPKNKDAKYTLASQTISDIPLLYYVPVLEKDLTNFNVVYSNGESFTSAFFCRNLAVKGIRERSDIGNLKEFAREMLKNNGERRTIGYNDIIKAYNSGEVPKTKKHFTEIDALQAPKSNDFKKRIKAKTEVKKANTRVVATTGNEVTWEYSTSDAKLKCRVDEKNKIDVFYLNSFSPKSESEFLNVLEKCISTFDKNEYPIVVINDYNHGGAGYLTALFQEMLQQDMTARMFLSFKNDERVHKVIKPYMGGDGFQNPATGKSFTTVEELMEGAEVDDYGNGVTHSRSKPALADYLDIRTRMDKVKPLIKRNRMPTEIIVFTDSFSFSAGSTFTKGLKEAGAAILVGYNGYPGSKKDTFDIGQSPTMVIDSDFDLLGKETYKRLTEKGIEYNLLSVGESYRLSDVENGVKPLVPREFLFDAADERVAIYSAYGDDKYDVFMEAAKSVFEKYKTQCNPDNLGLHMRNVLCDEKINKTHMHGGYVCGSDGKWSTQCEGYYCDYGYFFNTKTKECVVDRFSAINSSSMVTISLWALLFVLIFILF